MPSPQITPADFDKLTEALAFECQSAVVDYRMYMDLVKAAQEHVVVVQQSNAFWTMTVEAHRNSAILRMCRIYDQQASAMGLHKWLKLIKQNPKWLREPADPKTLDKDIEYVSNNNQKVKSLTMYRGNVIAHLGQNYLLNFRNTRTSFKFTYGDLKELVENGLKIVNRYGQLYKGHTWSPNLVGADDYKFVFSELKKAVERRRAEIDAEIERHRKQLGNP